MSSPVRIIGHHSKVSRAQISCDTPSTNRSRAELQRRGRAQACAGREECNKEWLRAPHSHVGTAAAVGRGRAGVAAGEKLEGLGASGFAKAAERARRGQEALWSERARACVSAGWQELGRERLEPVARREKGSGALRGMGLEGASRHAWPESGSWQARKHAQR